MVQGAMPWSVAPMLVAVVLFQAQAATVCRCTALCVPESWAKRSCCAKRASCCGMSQQDQSLCCRTGSGPQECPCCDSVPRDKANVWTGRFLEFELTSTVQEEFGYLTLAQAELCPRSSEPGFLWVLSAAQLCRWRL